jgi:tetratricopeptide (TPR) repeat protein
MGRSQESGAGRRMVAGWLAVLLTSGLIAQEPKQQKTPPPKPQQQEEAPPEEDESLKPKVFSFNPLEADRDVRIGNYYFKRHNYPAALSRFQEAAKWNPNMADAYLHIGETAEKMKDKATAKQAYRKYLELAPDSKDAERLKKKVEGN